MQLIKSDYQEGLVFVGTDSENLIKHEAVWLIEQEMGIESGRDFDGIESENMSPEHTNTKHDLLAYEILADTYEFVYFIRLRPVR